MLVVILVLCWRIFSALGPILSELWQKVVTSRKMLVKVGLMDSLDVQLFIEMLISIKIAL